MDTQADGAPWHWSIGIEKTDATLARAAQAGDRDAFAVLISRHYLLLLNLCRKMLRDSVLAEDAAQDAVVQALLNIDRLRHPDRFGPWLAGVGLNICRRWLRYRSHDSWSWEAVQDDGISHALRDQQPGPEDLVEGAELQERIRHAVTELPPGQRDAVLLFYLADLTQAETASALGVEVSAIKTRLYKARANLRSQLHTTIGAAMPVDIAEWIEFQVADIRRQTQGTSYDSDPPAQTPHHWLVLEEVNGTRRSIWGIPPFEAESLATLLHDIELPRPSPYALMALLLQAAGARARAVRMELLAERAIGARILITGRAGEHEIDARPSDAVNLAMIVGAPIQLSSTMLKDDDEEDSDLDRQALQRVFGEGSEGSAEIAAERAEQLSALHHQSH